MGFFLDDSQCKICSIIDPYCLVCGTKSGTKKCYECAYPYEPNTGKDACVFVEGFVEFSSEVYSTLSSSGV